MNFVLDIVCRIFILALGIVSNSIGVIVFALRKNFKKFPSRVVYIGLGLLSIMFTTTSILNDLFGVYGYKMEKISDFFCKLNLYMYEIFNPIVAWTLSFLSVDRFICIQFNNVQLNKKIWFQTTILFLIIICNLIAYTPAFFIMSLTNYTTNATNPNTVVCNGNKSAFELFDLINSTLIPFVVMLLFSSLLIYTIFSSRLKILRMASERDKARLKKDIKFAISSIFLNFFFLSLNLPIHVAPLLDISPYTELNVIFQLAIYLSFSVTFIIMFIFNSLFRKELLIMFRLSESTIRLFTIF
jgi:hypothetical protein